MESGDNTHSEKIAQAKKICVNLRSPDRKVRKQTFIDLEQLFHENLTDQELRDIFTETQVYFLNGLRDKSETVREQAIQFVSYLILQKYPLNDFYLTYLFPILVERIGSVELVEESEEIRLKMLELLYKITVKYAETDQLKPFFNDSVIILCECVKDKFPAIKDLSCRAVVQLAKSLPRDFHMQAETLLKPVLTCFTHQRFKVRVEAIEAVGEIVMHSSYKGVDEAVGPMAEKLFDQIPAVRQAVSEVSARWMLEHRDRYSYFHKMLPLVLTGLNDEVEATRNKAYMLWKKVGQQFLKENERDLKDKLDYLEEVPKNYPEGLVRPNLGCRVLVQRNISKLAGAISNELLSWQADVRVRCSQLLCSLALHAEEDLTFNLQSLLPAMYSAARDDDKRVVDNIVQASKIIGFFVTCETWLKLIIPAIDNQPHYGHITVLSGVIAGAETPKIYEHLSAISEVLAQDSICFSRKKDYQLALLDCLRSIEQHYLPPANSSSLTDLEFNIFKITTALISLSHPDNVDVLTVKLFEESAQFLLLSQREQMKLFSNRLFVAINKSPKMWTPVNDYACIFITLLQYAGSAFGENFDIMSATLTDALDIETDAELRLKVFYVLADQFNRKAFDYESGHGHQMVSSFLEKLVDDVFVPSLVWHAGATAEAIRTMAATCLKHALDPESGGLCLFSGGSDLEKIVQKLLPLLLSLLEDASQRSRQTAVECLEVVKENCVAKGIWQIDHLLKIYPEVLKRLDDPTDFVRLSALKCLEKLFRDVPEEFLEDNFKAHRELIIDTLMTHFDDDDVAIQALVMEVLKAVAKMNSSDMLKKIEIHRTLLRNQQGCDQLVEFMT